jgi:hypothetical protein
MTGDSMEVLDRIPFELDEGALLSELRVEEGTEDAANLKDLISAARSVARPKAVYGVCYVEDRGEDTVTVGGVVFTSRVLRANLADVERVFPYVSTCGRELDGIDIHSDDFMAPYWLDSIKAALLGQAGKHMVDRLKKRFRLSKTSFMAPGSGDRMVWPIEQQRELFSLFGNVEELIGVRLTESCLMVPNKSTSGIMYPAEKDFGSCQVCRRESCPGRSAPFDMELAESYGYMEEN